MKLFGALLRVKRQKIQRQSQQDSKRRKIMSDLDARERAAFAPDAPQRIARKLKDEIARIRAMHSKEKEAHTRAKESSVPLQPFQPPMPSPFFNAGEPSNLVIAGHQKFEDEELEKMRKAAQKKKSNVEGSSSS
ncbi:hypothetical protein RND71_027815 [Anisodus tanguticus]|uniref:Uncharacterized protein n=1 Tax=Anisodus tanguticus TaxID=243964 RepID=A0AAE1V233_9SOLA|nr:hypothetical protein RND71_027815 [Anisodus tanguticus]